MAIYNRDEAIKECLKWEGGYSNNPSDPGGPTNWGITIADARRYWKSDATAADVRAMPQSVAVNIYINKYWKTPQYDCDTLASGVDLAVFDFGVNSGPGRARAALDASVGGPSEDTINRICDYRIAFLHKLGTWGVFGAGWSRRVVGIRAKSLELAKHKPPAVMPHVIVAAITGATATAVATTQPKYWPWILAGLGVAGFCALYAIWKNHSKVQDAVVVK